MTIKGQVIGGELGKVLIRKKSDQNLEIGELLIVEDGDTKILLQSYDLVYGSQISQQNLELISGMNLESQTEIAFMDAKLRNYTMVLAKPLAIIRKKDTSLCKQLPKFFGEARELEAEDIDFMTKPKNPLFLGNIRSGSKVLEVPVSLPGEKTFTHHILIPATTGRGKSNLVKVMLWNVIDQDYCGILVLDPHDEYYGRNGQGLKDHPAKENILYYTPKNPPVGARTLKINITQVRPSHFRGATTFTDAQEQAVNAYHREYGKKWIEAIILEKPLKMEFHEATIGVIRRKIMQLLGIQFDGERAYTRGIFDLNAGETTIKDICTDLEEGKTVIIDTSSFGGSVEILIGSMITNEIFNRYKQHKMAGKLESKPVISVVLEEAPRVLGKEALERGPNIFSTIAREGRKFKIGLTAITQLPSLIPREILANMNTKIILGIEMKPERQAVIESASQDLSTDDRNIASLDKGEAIITSNFARFATPIKIPLFEDVVRENKTIKTESSSEKTKDQQATSKQKIAFSGIKLNG